MGIPCSVAGSARNTLHCYRGCFLCVDAFRLIRGSWVVHHLFLYKNARVTWVLTNTDFHCDEMSEGGQRMGMRNTCFRLSPSGLSSTEARSFGRTGFLKSNNPEKAKLGFSALPFDESNPTLAQKGHDLEH